VGYCYWWTVGVQQYFNSWVSFQQKTDIRHHDWFDLVVLSRKTNTAVHRTAVTFCHGAMCRCCFMASSATHTAGKWASRLGMSSIRWTWYMALVWRFVCHSLAVLSLSRSMLFRHRSTRTSDQLTCYFWSWFLSNWQAFWSYSLLIVYLEKSLCVILAGF